MMQQQESTRLTHAEAHTAYRHVHAARLAFTDCLYAVATVGSAAQRMQPSRA